MVVVNVPGCVGIPVTKPLDAESTPLLFAPLTLRPGGKSVIRNEPAGVDAPVTENTRGAKPVPTVPVAGEGRLNVNCVAPASACALPSDASVTTADRNTAQPGAISIRS